MALLTNTASTQSCSLDAEQFPAINAPDIALLDTQEFQRQLPPCAGLLPEARDLYVTVKGRITAGGPEEISDHSG